MSEILGTLFKYLVAILGVAAVVLILNKTFGANKVQNTIAQVTQTTANIQALYNAQNNFTSLNNAVVIAGKLATDTYGIWKKSGESLEWRGYLCSRYCKCSTIQNDAKWRAE